MVARLTAPIFLTCLALLKNGPKNCAKGNQSKLVGLPSFFYCVIMVYFFYDPSFQLTIAVFE